MTVEVPASKMKLEITRILHEKGYILAYKVVEGQPCNTIKMALKYHPETKKAAVKKLIRVSSPGLRTYTDVASMPRVLNGLGIAILSTSKGIITDKEARDLNVGGEVICYVY
jgi:small subunit ribosomal protein S8